MTSCGWTVCLAAPVILASNLRVPGQPRQQLRRPSQPRIAHGSFRSDEYSTRKVNENTTKRSGSWQQPRVPLTQTCVNWPTAGSWGHWDNAFHVNNLAVPTD